MSIRLFHDRCKSLLVYKSQIILNVLCNFTLSGDNIKITKYTAGNIGKECPPDSLNVKKDKVRFFCSKCEMDSTVDNACFKCDSCEGYFSLGQMIRIGLTLVICDGCSRREPTYKEFTAVLPKFDSKKLRVDEKSLENAVAEIPGILEYGEARVGEARVNPVGRVRLDYNDFRANIGGPVDVNEAAIFPPPNPIFPRRRD